MTPTSRTKRTPEAVPTWTIRPTPTKWLDYLYGNNQGVFGVVQDENWEDISIFANSWYEEVPSWTIWTKRTAI